AEKGQLGMVHTVPQGFSPGSDVANMGILGYDPKLYYTGRGPIEAASLGLSIPNGKIVFRCNLVTIENNIMKDFTADHISTEEGRELLNMLNEECGEPSEFYPGVSYRHILLHDQSTLDVKTTAPHDITDKDIGPHLPSGPHAKPLLDLMADCHKLLSKTSSKANWIWPWSQGHMPHFPNFTTQYGHTGGIVTAVDLLKGIGQLAGLETPDIPGATGFIDTDYKAKLAAAFSILENHSFVYIHIEAPDEAGHMGDAKLKTKAIEDFDKQIVSPVLDYIKSNPDTHVMVLPDHPTPCTIKTHLHAPVPVAIYYPGISPDRPTMYNESDAQNGSLAFDTPWDLLTYFLDISS
ncbi:MAG: cofactor-independent phosphoglycerate mutase, partial [Candidatus Margulisbacteria bacterium]|nr:cofactor-independent phosphoglycerate mutase [Candidatus Margulisiibacteriota bacterium]